MESGGLNVKDIETLIKASRLAWTGKLFSNGPLPWDAYFNYLLKDFGGEFLFSCNYDVEECKIYSKFCNEFLQWWADFRHFFSTKPPMSKYIIWNNKGIKIDNKSIYYPADVKAGILFCHHLQFHNIQSYYNARGIGVKKHQLFSVDRGKKCDTFSPKSRLPNEKELGPVRIFCGEENL